LSESLRIDVGQTEKSKGRTFKAALAGIITADAFWPGGTRTAHRPIYLSFFGTDSTVQAIRSCLRTGRPGIIETQHGTALDGGAKQVEIVRSAGLKWPKPQKLGDGVSAATAYLPELCLRDPGALPDKVRFLFAPPQNWIDRQMPGMQHLPAAHRRDAALGAWLAGYIDGRTPLPLVKDPTFEFYRRLYVAAKAEEWWCTRSTNEARPAFWYFPTMPVDLPELAMVEATQDEMADFIKRETGLFLREVGIARPQPVVVPTREIIRDRQELPEISVPLPAPVWAPLELGVSQRSLFDEFDF